jgi:hypothetical protein
VAKRAARKRTRASADIRLLKRAQREVDKGLKLVNDILAELRARRSKRAAAARRRKKSR